MLDVETQLHQTSHTIILTPLNNSKCCQCFQEDSTLLSACLYLPLTDTLTATSYLLCPSTFLSPPSHPSSCDSLLNPARGTLKWCFLCASSNSWRAVRQTKSAGARCMTHRGKGKIIKMRGHKDFKHKDFKLLRAWRGGTREGCDGD